jgi:cytidylate kinase
MRLAISGTHGSGKTTLAEDFLAAHSGYRHVPEP